MSHDSTSPTRWYVFTINNPNNQDYLELDSLEKNVVYLCYGHEIAESGTPHLQGYVELSNPQRFSWIKKRLTRAYIADRRGSRTQARDYCFKECDKGFEYGKFVADNSGSRNDIRAIKRKIDENPHITELELYEDHYGTMQRCSKGHLRYKFLKLLTIKMGPVECIWIYGDSGAGKSRFGEDAFPDHYKKDNTKWWDGYQGQETVLWQDYENKAVPYQTFLQWTDRYTKKGEVKGGYVALTYTRLIIDSSFAPDYSDKQITRRFCDGANITPVTSLQNTDFFMKYKGLLTDKYWKENFVTSN